MPHRTKTAHAAVGRWPRILQALGVQDQYLSNRHGPCPVCGGKDRFRFDDKQGRGTWFCNRCGSGDGFCLLMQVYGWDFSKAAKEVDQVVGSIKPGTIAQERSEESKLEALRAVWKSSKPVTKGDPVSLYLNQRLGIDTISNDVRFHPALIHSDGGKHPAMLALMRYPDGTPASIHRTYLTEGGNKAAVSEVKKIMAGKPVKTASVRLKRAGICLGIAEGIETALAASIRFGVPFWAATNAVLLDHWVPPEGVKRILIAGDNDESYTGQAAAFSLARRLDRDGYEVEVSIPAETGKDWADR